MTTKTKILITADASGVRAGVKDASRSLAGLADEAKSLLGPVSGLFAGVGVGSFIGKLVTVQREFDVLNSSLITVTGSSSAAAREFAWIKEFAATTPFALNEVTQGFVKMKALGLDATEEALRSYGNTASAMGKGLDQMIEAVADASTGQFERLLEFGIKAKQEGNKVSLTFQGVTKNIANNSREIVRYLQDIGNVEFGTAMAERAKTLDSALGSLGDTWSELFLTVSQQGVGSVIQDAIEVATQSLKNWNQYLSESKQERFDALVGRQMQEQALLSKLPPGSMIARRQQERVDALNAEIKALREEREREDREMKFEPPTPTASSALGRAPKPSSPTRSRASDADPLGVFMSDIASSIRPAEEAMDRFRSMQLDATAATAGLTNAETEFLKTVSSPAWESMGEPWKEFVRVEFEAANAAEKAREAVMTVPDAAKDAAGQFEDLKRTIQGWGEDSAQAIVDFALTGKSSISDMVKSMLADMAKMMIYKNVTGPMASAVAGFNWLSLFTPNADGGVYDSPSLSAYSNQVHSTPKFFQFANGGVFAEAGPEAIMPLSRDSRGRLGVKAEGGGGVSLENVRVEIKNEGKPQEVASAQPRFDADGLVVSVVLRDLRSNGPIRQALG